MTTDAKGLRNEVVEAMAQARYERIGGVSWAECPAKRLWLEDAAGDLDAALDILGKRMGEWDALAYGDWTREQNVLPPGSRNLLAALADSGKGDS